eukprot:scpid42513/ scgid5633/ Probable RNA-directed DNA polymerase from transposon X-element; Reverse transcriptase
MNSSGKELLDFLAMNNATICNTWHNKRQNLKPTWQHPKSQKWHCIDYIITGQCDRMLCMDSQIIPSAECGSDHQLLCARFLLGTYHHSVNPQAVRVQRSKGRFDTSKLFLSADANNNPDDGATPLSAYQDAVSTLVSTHWRPHDPIDEKWNVLRDAVVTAGTDTLGQRKRKQPDWYVDSGPTIEPLLQERNRLHALWLQHQRPRDHTAFKQARSQARAGVRKAKRDWISSKAELANAQRFSGRTVWKCVRALQTVEQGPTRITTAAINDENGNPCASAEDQGKRWGRHFSGVLNVQSTFNSSILDCVPQMPCLDSLVAPPDLLELQQAITQCRSGKAAGQSGILPEMLKACPDLFTDHLLELLHSVWDSGSVPGDWVNAQLVPIPKKGNLAECDNWRGIALLDVIGKVVARVIQSRLADKLDDVLPDSQCGFRTGRGCADMIFAARQLIEKSYEHEQKCFFIFIDLKKAYDSVPRECLWLVLRKAGVPEKLIAVIRAFHDGMTATLRLSNVEADPIPVTNGLRQGCCMAPVLFNIFMWAVMHCWRQHVQPIPGVGAKVFFEPDGKLLHHRSRRDRSLELTECQFADDSALVAATRQAAVSALEVFVDVCSDFGLTVSATKTKFMVSGPNISNDDLEPLAIRTMEIAHVSSFRYLGSNIHSNGRCHDDVTSRISVFSPSVC